MKERQYFAAREAAKAEYEEKLRSLDIAWQMVNHTPPPRQPAQLGRRKAPEGASGHGLATSLLTVIEGMPAEFNTLDVDMMLRKLRPDFSGSRSTVTHTLKRMSNGPSAPIEIVEIGRGKRPTKYKKLTQEAVRERVVSLDDI